MAYVFLMLAAGLIATVVVLGFSYLMIMLVGLELFAAVVGLCGIGMAVWGFIRGMFIVRDFPIGVMTFGGLMAGFYVAVMAYPALFNTVI